MPTPSPAKTLILPSLALFSALIASLRFLCTRPDWEYTAQAEDTAYPHNCSSRRQPLTQASFPMGLLLSSCSASVASAR